MKDEPILLTLELHGSTCEDCKRQTLNIKFIRPLISKLFVFRGIKLYFFWQECTILLRDKQKQSRKPWQMR